MVHGDFSCLLHRQKYQDTRRTFDRGIGNRRKCTVEEDLLEGVKWYPGTAAAAPVVGKRQKIPPS